MKIDAGNLYFVSNKFFTKVNDPYLKINYENTKRPHYFAFLDKETGLYWLVPCSSKVEKIEHLIRKKKLSELMRHSDEQESDIRTFIREIPEIAA